MGIPTRLYFDRQFDFELVAKTSVMKYHKNEARRSLNALEVVAVISTVLLVGTLIAVKISFGSELKTLSDIGSFGGIVILLGVIGGGPILALIYFFTTSVYGNPSDIYDTAWSDGIRDYPEYQKNINKSGVFD